MEMEKNATVNEICADHSNTCLTLINDAIFSTFLTTFGILSNFSVIFVTIRTKTLRGSVNILLTFYSLCEIANLSGNFLTIYSVFSGHYFMTNKNGIYFVTISFIGSFCALNLMLFIGIERLFVVLFPLKNLNESLFLFIVFVLNIIQIAILILLLLFFNSYDVKMLSQDVIGNYYEMNERFFHSLNRQLLIYILADSAIITVCSVIVYVLIAVLILCRKVLSNANSAQFNYKILRSLFAIILINFGGYLIACFYAFITNLIGADSNSPLFGLNSSQLLGILVHISASSSGPILYLTSSEYRAAFQKQFSFLSKLFCRCKSSSSSSTVVVPLR